MSRRPRILLLTIHACRMPGSGGNVRSHFFARAAAEIGSLTVLSLCGATGQCFDPAIAGLAEQVFGGEHAAETRTTPRKATRGSAWRLLAFPWRDNWRDFVSSCVQHCGASRRATPAGRQRWFQRILKLEHRLLCWLRLLPPQDSLAWFNEYTRLKPVLQQIIQSDPFDVLWVEDVFAWPYAEDLLRQMPAGRVKVIVNAYNVESLVMARMAATASNQAEAAVLMGSSRQLARMERSAFRRSDLTFLCSPQDLAVASTLVPEGHFVVVGNGVDLDYFSSTLRKLEVGEDSVLLLTGTFGYGPNFEAAQFFAAQVLPLIRQQLPGTRFMIAGGQAAAAQLELRKAGLDVLCVSDPPDIRPSFEQAAVFVVPLLSGGGTRLKIVEAMAMQVPIVSTTLGAEGLGAEHGVHLLLADTPAAMAASCLSLLQNKVRRERLCAEALTWVRDRYDWTLLCRKICIEYEQHIEV